MKVSIKGIVAKPVQFAAVLALGLSVLAPVQSAQALSGLGTEQSPYQIWDCEDLQEIELDLDAYYIVGDDIDCAETADWNSGTGFAPIGIGEGGSFKGELDGNGHTISNLFINLDEWRVGLFGQIGDYNDQVGLVKDLGLANVDITGGWSTGGLVGVLYGQANNTHTTGFVSGEGETGGLVGSHGGVYDTVIDSWSSVDVSGTELVGGLVGYNAENSNIINSYATGGVAGSYRRVGGLVGYNNGNVTNAHATGMVSGGGDDMGGLIGRSGSSAVVSKSYATGHVVSEGSYVGGFVGNNYGHIDQAYSDNDEVMGGEVRAFCYAGGFVGLNQQNAEITNTFTRSNAEDSECGDAGYVSENYGNVVYAYSTGTSDGWGFANLANQTGGIWSAFWDLETSGTEAACGYGDFDCTMPYSVTGLETVDMKDPDTYGSVLGEAQWNFETIWDIDQDVNDGYPFFIDTIGATSVGLPLPDEVVPDGGEDAGAQIILPNDDANKAILIEQQEGSELCSAFDDSIYTRTESQLEAQDAAYDYSSVFVGFTMTGCDVGGTTTMRVVFTGDFDPAKTDVRKYNAVTKQYDTIDATKTATTLNDLPALEVTYSITDGGELDQDGQANGTIVDPVGLGAQVSATSGTTNLASSGQNTTMYLLSAATIFALASGMFVGANKRRVAAVTQRG